MTIFCSHCHRPLQAEMSCLPRRAEQAPGASKPFRSTKSASKARRDQINTELQALRSLLPISTQEKERLSYLHTMALVCLQLRGAHLFPPAGGKLVYISENVSQILGLSMVELLAQGDTIFDILDGRAREDVHKKLLLAQEQPGREITFVSEMRTSKAFRLQHGGNRAVAVRGHFMPPRWPASPSTTAFLALCTPVARLDADHDSGSQDNMFQSTHALDMRFMDVTERPVEMSAKKPVPFLRQVVSVTKQVHRDPRFDDLSGEYNPEIFMKTYSFLDTIKKQEKEMVQKQLKKCRNVEQKEKLQQLLNRMTQQEQAQKKQQKRRERELALKRQQRELAKQGKKPFFLKNSDKRKLELAEKYAELKRSGKLESFLNKKRKRNAIKDKRRLPPQKNL
ncbi:UNVERIFIED_CONTAM: hypothetical protein H355_006861 [Colinus virginianus]|nr:hypothetical protein H355_006861 [Colinus virginianus]